MWTINNRTLYKAKATWGRDKDGVHEWIVAVKATYDINPHGKPTPAAEQLEPLIAPEYHGEPGLSSLRYDADLIGVKPTTDVLINGTAHAPGGRPSREFPVTMSVGPVHKTIVVKGDRTRSRGAVLAISGTTPVDRVPIVYERAFGGYEHADPDPKRHKLDTRNPVGCGLATDADHSAPLPLPNFEYPGGSVEKAGPAGFGAIDSFWSPRRELAGTYDKSWQQNRLPLLPQDWDARCLMCSPADQRPESYLRGGETVELTNLTPNGWLSFALPKTYLTFSTLVHKRNVEHRASLATVIVEPDYPRIIMVWTTSIKCPVDVDYLEETLIREKRVLQ